MEHAQRPVRHFVQQMLSSYSVNIFVLSVTFIASIFIARILGPEDRGIYAWLMTIHAMLSSAILLGFDTVLRKQGTTTCYNQSAWFYTACLAGIGCLALLCFPVYYGLVQTSIGARYPQYILFVIGMAAFSHIMACSYMVVAAQNRVWLYNIMSAVPRLTGFAVVMLTVYFGVLTIKSTILAYLLPNIGIVLFLIWFFHKKLGFVFTLKPKLLAENWRFMGASYCAFLALLMLLKADQILLGLYGFTSQLGHYSVAVSLIDALQLGPMLAGTFLLPRLTAMPEAARWGFYVKIISLLAVCMAAIAAVGAISAPWIIPLLFGDAYVSSIPLLQILLVALVCLSLMTVTQHALPVYTEGWRLTCAPVTAFIVNLVLNIIWIPTHGAMGAAWASLVAYAVGLVLVLVIIHRTRHMQKTLNLKA